MGKRIQGILIGVLVGAFLAGGVAYAVTVVPPDSSDRYYACVSTTGVVRYGTMRLNVTPASCPKATDTVRSWNAQGPPGPSGTALCSGIPHVSINLSGCNLRGASFSGDLTNANFTNANLTGANFSNANLTGVDFSGANLTDARVSGSLGTNFTGANLTRATLQQGDAAGVGVVLSGADMTETTLARTGFKSVVGEPAVLPADWQIVDGNLIGPAAEFQFANLAGINLAGANLACIGNHECTNFLFSDLHLADLSGANLSGARFQESNLAGADLTNANLSCVEFNGSTDCVSFAGANLTEADFTGANLGTWLWWGNTTCPDGTNSDNNDGTCIGHLNL